SLDKMLYPLPDNPSIAVLPFDNMSADPEQEYFSDGITEEIITALAKVPDIFVIARNSTFVYKGKPVNIKQVSEELGVRYVLEGGVRKAGDRIRITAQLIDAIKGHHLWAERYDGTMGDVFDLQDKITQKIIAALAVILTQDQGEIISDWGTKNTEAYDAYLQAGAHLFPQTRDNVAKAIDYLNKAVELDPNFGPAHVRLARAYNAIISRQYDKELGISNARSLYQKHLKLALQNPTAGAHMVAVWGYLFSGKIEEAMSHAELAISMEPNSAQACETLGGALIYEGRPEEAIKYISKAMRINPEYPAMTLWWLGVAQFCDQQLEDAATTLGRARKRNPHLAPWFQIAAYEHVGRGKENPEIIAEYIKARGWKGLPSNLIEKVMQWYQFKDPNDRKLLISGLQKAGLK
ncbi:MAG: tetratricopeptide repeat protein, partial [Desulfobacterales bacterium]|nr:tetratricopeptide repeat protein [Desulfobacterales bacterium]